MGTVMERVRQCVEDVRKKTGFVPRTAVVLGSGLGDFAEKIKREAVVDYKEIGGFPVSTVAGHQGRFVFGYVGNEPVAVMQGRVHYYEGYSMEDVVLPLRVLHALGAQRVILTNAAGGIGPNLEGGDLMLITDHITSFVPSPLIGPNEDELGPRFPDMTEIYSKRLGGLARKAAEELSIPLKEGVYLQTTGPNYETPAEIRMIRTLGANAVGMSTACEAMIARHMDMEVCGISCVTNMAAGLCEAPLSHEEVQEVADRVAERFQGLLWKLLETIE